MMNKIWGYMLFISIIFAFFCGNFVALEQAIMESSTKAVDFIISICGIMALWSGLMEIAERTHLIDKLAVILLPFVGFLFPGQRDKETLSSIVMSFMSNIFGAGNSSTVFALRTMEKLDIQNNKSKFASNDMCMFAVVNMAIAPLFPIMTIKVRTEAGSVNPYSTVIPSIITAAITIVVSIMVCKYFERKNHD